MPGRVALLFLLVLLAACSFGPSEREEAGALLEQLLRLDPAAPPADRQRELAALEALPLTHPELLEVRQICSGVQRGLLQAEARQFAARQALETAEREPRDGGIPPARARSIAEAIRGSQNDLDQAAKALPECQTRLRALTVRYR
jgi:hypothetical protein